MDISKKLSNLGSLEVLPKLVCDKSKALGIAKNVIDL
jgi:hypothetical protein